MHLTAGLPGALPDGRALNAGENSKEVDMQVPLENPASFHLRPGRYQCPRCEGGFGYLCNDCAPVKFNDCGFAPKKERETKKKES